MFGRPCRRLAKIKKFEFCSKRVERLTKGLRKKWQDSFLEPTAYAVR